MGSSTDRGPHISNLEFQISDLKSRILLPYQQRWVNDKSPLKIWLAARQVGKSFALAMEAVTLALLSKCNNLVLTSSERQSTEVMRKVYVHLRWFDVKSSEVWAAERETREEVTLPNGSRIISLPANPDTVRGFSGNVFLDEFAFHRDAREIWRAMYPAVARGYKVRVSSTPNGRQDMFWELWGSAENLKSEISNLKSPEGGWSRHRTSIYDAVAEGLDVDVEALRRGVGDPEAWAQEFECEFLDEATALLTFEMIASCEDEAASILYPSFPGLTGESSNGGMDSRLRHAGMTEKELYLGVDVGRKHDLTVFWLLERVGDVLWTRAVMEMRNAPFREQREVLYGLMDGSAVQSQISNLKFQMPAVRRACIDASGIGAQLAEEARERFGHRVEPVAFTLPVKEDLAVTLRRRFEERELRVPGDRAIRADLHSVKKGFTQAGNMRFDAGRGEDSHADRFWALALAVHAASAPAAARISYEGVAPREFRPKFQTPRPAAFQAAALVGGRR